MTLTMSDKPGSTSLEKRFHHLIRGKPLKTFLSLAAAAAVAAVAQTPTAIWVPAIITLLLCWIDGVTGMLAAAYTGTFKSKTCWQGGATKMAVYATFAIPSWIAGYLVYKYAPAPINLAGWSLPAACSSWIGVTEISSIRENVKKLEAASVKLGPIGKLLDAWDKLLQRFYDATTKESPQAPQ